MRGSGGPLEIVTKSLPDALAGTDYFACLYAQGGTPWTGTTRPGKTAKSGKGRYWEYPESTLLHAAAEDRIDFKKADDAIPAIKTYLLGRTSARRNQMSLWSAVGKAEGDPFGVGWAQDAKAELEELVTRDVIRHTVATSKPSRLVCRLLALFTTPDSWVVDVGSPAGEMSSLATALGRRAIHVHLSSANDATVIRPRMLYASRGEHPLPDGILFANPNGMPSSAGYYVSGKVKANDASANVCELEIGPPIAVVDRLTSTVTVDYAEYPARGRRFLDGLASIEGMIPRGDDQAWFGVSADGLTRAAYIPPEGWLSADSVERLAKHHEEHLQGGGRLRIYAHRGGYLPEEGGDGRIEGRLIPHDLKVIAGAL
jgi:hypothetical protein